MASMERQVSLELAVGRRILRLLLFLSLALPLAGLVALTRTDQVYWRHAFFLTWYGLALAVVECRLGHRRQVANLMLSTALVNLIVLGPEVGLRLAGFRHESGIQFGYPRPVGFFYFVPDEELFWKLPSQRADVNSWGFRGPEIEPGSEDGVRRVLVLGDSVSSSYPEMVEALLNSAAAAPRYEVVNLSQSGYSSHQGRIVAERYGRLVEPHLVLVSYGWNDHWLAWGEIDAEKKIRQDRSWKGRLLFQVYHRSRLTQAALYLARPILGDERPLAEIRVPPELYRRNLDAIADLFAESGQPVFITSPSAHERLGVPGRLVERGLAIDAESVLELHREYNRIVREVALSRRAPVLDLERRAAELDEIELAKVFLDDGIHLTSYGEAWASYHVARALSSLGDS